MQADAKGVEAVCHLGKGDMRQTLNILQSVVLAHGRVSHEFAYLCTGNPAPETIEELFSTLLQKDMKSSFACLQRVQVRPFTCFHETWLRVQNVKWPRVCVDRSRTICRGNLALHLWTY